MIEAWIGTKIVLAEFQEKDGRPGYAITYEDGYQSWSPVGAFLRAYRRVSMAEKALVETGQVPT